jgi:hypothetical protein
MELADILTHLRNFYFDKFDRPPHEVTMGRVWYEKAREQGIVDLPPTWQSGPGRVLDMRIHIDPRDDYKLAIEDYRRYQDRAQHRFELRD